MNETEILNNARIKLASILNGDVLTEKLASTSLARNIKDLLLPPALGVLGSGAAGALS